MHFREPRRCALPQDVLKLKNVGRKVRSFQPSGCGGSAVRLPSLILAAGCSCAVATREGLRPRRREPSRRRGRGRHAEGTTGRIFGTVRTVKGLTVVNRVPTTGIPAGDIGEFAHIRRNPIRLYHPLTTRSNPDYRPATPVAAAPPSPGATPSPATPSSPTGTIRSSATRHAFTPYPTCPATSTTTPRPQTALPAATTWTWE